MKKKSRGRPRGRSAKGEETKRRLFERAIRLFAERGFEATTMRALADDAEVSPGLVYRYFESKRAVVHALYEELSGQYAERARPLPAGSWTARFFHAVEASLAVLEPHRPVLAALTGVLVSDDGAGLFSSGTTASRVRVMAVFEDAVAGAEDAPSDPAPLARALYVAHLGIILSWLLDKSPEQRATWHLLEMAASMSSLAAVAVLLPQVAPAVAATDRFVRCGLFGEADDEDHAMSTSNTSSSPPWGASS